MIGWQRVACCLGLAVGVVMVVMPPWTGTWTVETSGRVLDERPVGYAPLFAPPEYPESELVVLDGEDLPDKLKAGVTYHAENSRTEKVVNRVRVNVRRLGSQLLAVALATASLVGLARRRRIGAE